MLTHSQPLAASDQVPSILSQSRDAIFAGRFKEALKHAQPIYFQLFKSNYVSLASTNRGSLALTNSNADFHVQPPSPTRKVDALGFQRLDQTLP